MIYQGDEHQSVLKDIKMHLMCVCCLVVVEFELLNNCPQTHLIIRIGIVLRCPHLIHYITHTNIGFSFFCMGRVASSCILLANTSKHL